jgi:hypothetical protein
LRKLKNFLKMIRFYVIQNMWPSFMRFLRQTICHLQWCEFSW